MSEPTPGVPAKNPSWPAVLATTAVALFGIYFIVTRHERDQPEAPKAVRPCVIQLPSGPGRVVVFPTKEGFDAATRAAAVRDNVGYRNAFDQYGGFGVESGTTCLRLLESSHVRLTSGLFKDQDVWLPQEWHGLD